MLSRQHSFHISNRFFLTMETNLVYSIFMYNGYEFTRLGYIVNIGKEY